VPYSPSCPLRRTLTVRGSVFGSRREEEGAGQALESFPGLAAMGAAPHRRNRAGHRVVTLQSQDDKDRGVASETGTTHQVSSSTCELAEQEALAVTEGLINGASVLRKARTVPLTPPVSSFRFVLAAEIDGSGLEGDGHVGAWAVGNVQTGGPIIALDDNARRYSDWGSAAREGSGADIQRASIAARAETAFARECVKS
jgi:hypothetical protein